jgi:hypothetical protein
LALQLPPPAQLLTSNFGILACWSVFQNRPEMNKTHKFAEQSR